MSGVVPLPTRDRQTITDTIAATRFRVALQPFRQVAVSELELGRPDLGARFFLELLRDEPRECIVAAYTNVRNHLVAWQQCYAGTINRTACEPRLILQGALLTNAAGIILGHNHTSGDPEPSSADLHFTRRVRDAGELIGIRLLDHLIVAPTGRYVSLQRRGAW